MGYSSHFEHYGAVFWSGGGFVIGLSLGCLLRMGGGGGTVQPANNSTRLSKLQLQ